MAKIVQGESKTKRSLDFAEQEYLGRKPKIRNKRAMPNLFGHCRAAAYLNRSASCGKVQGESKTKRSLHFAEQEYQLISYYLNGLLAGVFGSEP
ncbi:MAG: hypothetical protein K2F92_07945 [Alistipes sp.]|nr:hypothetical protein [Alistipes sp.]